MSTQPSEPVVDLLIPMTKLHMEPAPSAPPPALPAAIPVEAPPPTAIPLQRDHHGALAVLIAGCGSGIGVLLALMGGIVGLVLGAGLLGALPAVLLGLVTATAAWGLSHVDLGNMDCGLMDPRGRPLALRGRLVGMIACGAWGFVLFTIAVFQAGFLLGKAAGR